MLVLDIGLLVSIGVAIIGGYLFFQTLQTLRAAKKYIQQQSDALAERDQLIIRLAFELEKHGGSDDQLIIEEARELLSNKTRLENNQV